MDRTRDTEGGDCLLLNRYRKLLHQRQTGQGVKLTVYLHTVPSLRISGSIPSLNHMPSLSNLANIKKSVFTHSYHPVGLALVMSVPV